MIRKPTLLLDETKCRRNIQRMAEKASRCGVRLRPHFKTHQSLIIGEWCREAGIDAATVSSVSMARYFVEGGWSDITIAFPANILELPAIDELLSQAKLNLLVESPDTVRALAMKLTRPAGLFLKVNLGNNRTGLDPTNHDGINAILSEIENATQLTFLGFLGHAGQSYACRERSCIEKVHRKSLQIMAEMRDNYGQDYPDLQISIGDTPTCSLMEDFPGVDEIRPGNFVLYDLMQLEIGSCAEEDIAVAMACPVVALHPERSEVIVYGGGIHFSKDRLEGPVFGRVVENRQHGWGPIIPEAFVRSLSQEHGVVRMPPEQIEKLELGAVLMILPVHSCMAVDLMPFYLTTTGRRIEVF